MHIDPPLSPCLAAPDYWSSQFKVKNGQISDTANVSGKQSQPPAIAAACRRSAPQTTLSSHIAWPPISNYTEEFCFHRLDQDFEDAEVRK